MHAIAAIIALTQNDRNDYIRRLPLQHSRDNIDETSTPTMTKRYATTMNNKIKWYIELFMLDATAQAHQSHKWILFAVIFEWFLLFILCFLLIFLPLEIPVEPRVKDNLFGHSLAQRARSGYRFTRGPTPNTQKQSKKWIPTTKWLWLIVCHTVVGLWLIYVHYLILWRIVVVIQIFRRKYNGIQCECEEEEEEENGNNLVNDLTIESNITEMRINKNSAIVSIEMNNAGYFQHLRPTIFGHRIRSGVKDSKKVCDACRVRLLLPHRASDHNGTRSSAGCRARSTLCVDRSAEPQSNANKLRVFLYICKWVYWHYRENIKHESKVTRRHKRETEFALMAEDFACMPQFGAIKVVILG